MDYKILPTREVKRCFFPSGSIFEQDNIITEEDFKKSKYFNVVVTKKKLVNTLVYGHSLYPIGIFPQEENTDNLESKLTSRYEGDIAEGIIILKLPKHLVNVEVISKEEDKKKAINDLIDL